MGICRENRFFNVHRVFPPLKQAILPFSKLVGQETKQKLADPTPETRKLPNRPSQTTLHTTNQTNRKVDKPLQTTRYLCQETFTNRLLSKPPQEAIGERDEKA
jgi:hypothetical protein